MGKLVAIRTYDRFQSMREASQISDTSLTFILDTGLLYTHGLFFNSVLFGTEVTNQSIVLNIAGVPKTLSLSGHSHTEYYSNSSDIDIGSYKIVSGTSELLKFSNGSVLIGNSSNTSKIYGTIKSIRNSTEYTVLDTGNFKIESKTTSGTPLMNVATFTYGSTNFQLDYVKRANGVAAFTTLSTYTNVGTTSENSKNYGFVTMCTDTGTSLNDKYALLRINIPDGKFEFRTSSHTDWISFIQGGSYKTWSINGSNYSVASSSNSLPTFVAPTTLGSNGQFLGITSNTLSWTTPDSSITSSSTNIVTALAVYNYINNDIKDASLSSVNLSTSWSPIDDLSNRLTTNSGSYLLQVTYGSRMYTGYFTYTLSGTIEEEILLHCAGTVDSVGNTERGRLYAKIGTSDNKVYLKLATTQAESNAVLSIKYRKLL